MPSSGPPPASAPGARAPVHALAHAPALVAPPAIGLHPRGSALAEARPFLRVRHVDLVARYPQGGESAPFPYDLIERRALDAVIVVAFARGSGTPGGTGLRGLRVFVRSAVRPPLGLRATSNDPADAQPSDANQWELPAGLIEPGETPQVAAARETEEELGFRLDEKHFETLGPYVYPAPAMIAERQHYVAVDVTGCARGIPTEDGSPLERHAAIALVAFEALLGMARRGELRDAKTELALRRLAEKEEAP